MPLNAVGFARLVPIRELRKHWLRSAALVAVVAVSSSLLVAVLGIYGSLTQSATGLSTSIAGNASILAEGVTDGGVDLSVVPTVRATQGVSGVAPIVQDSVTVGDSTALLLGADSNILSTGSTLVGEFGGGAAQLLAEGNVIAGPHSGLTPGDHIVNDQTVHVIAVATSELNAGRYVLSSLPTAQQLTGLDGRATTLLISHAPSASETDVIAALRSAVGDRVNVLTIGERTEQLLQSSELTRNATILVATVAYLVVAFLIFNSLSMAIQRRRRDLAVLRAVGATRQTLFTTIVAEAGVIGVVGGVLGIPLGIFAGSRSIGRLPSFSVDALEAQILYRTPSPAALVLCAVISFIAATLGAVAAAIQVTRIEPVEALRQPPATSARGPVARRNLAVTALGVVLIVIAIPTSSARTPLIAFAGTAGLLIGAIAVLLAFIRPLGNATAALARRAGAPGLVAASGIARSPWRTWASVITVVIAVSASAGISGTLSNLTRSVTASLSPLANTDIYVSLSPEDTLPAKRFLAADAVDAVRGTPGVASAIGSQWAYATVDGTSSVLNGVSEGGGSPALLAIPAAVRPQVIDGQGVAISASLAQAHGYQTGQSITLVTPTGPHTTPILAVIDYLTVVPGTVVMALPVVEQWFARPGITQLEIHAQPGTAIDALMATIKDRLPPSYTVFPGSRALDGVSGSINQASSLAVSMNAIVGVVAAFGLLTILLLTVLGRIRELGALRALGASRRFLATTVLAEAGAIGVTGGVIGTVLGLALQYAGGRVLSSSTVFTIEYHVTGSALAYLVAAIVISLVGALIPAWYASRMNIVTAITTD